MYFLAEEAFALFSFSFLNLIPGHEHHLTWSPLTLAVLQETFTGGLRVEEVSRLETSDQSAAAALPSEERLHGLHAMFGCNACDVESTRRSLN